MMRTAPLLALLLATLATVPLHGQELEHLLTLPSGELFFGDVGDVDVGSEGQVVVMDVQADLVYVFDASGALVHRLGGEGRGPGEIMLSTEVEVGPDGSVVVVDAQNLRLTRWDASGELVAEAAFTDLFGQGFHWPHDLVWSEAGLFLKVSQFTPDSPLQVFRIPESLAGTAEAVVTVAPGEDATTCTFCPIAVDRTGAVVAAAGDTLYLVGALAADGRRTRSWARADLPAVRRSESEIDRLGAVLAQRAGAEGGSGGRDMVDPFKTRFGPHSVGFDGVGRLWIAPRVDDGQPGFFDLFSPAGGRLGSVTLDVPVEGFRVRGEHLAIRTQSPLGEPQVQLYRIRP